MLKTTGPTYFLSPVFNVDKKNLLNHMKFTFYTLTALCCFTVAITAEQKKPNIIILFADDLGYGELGCQGNYEIPTPHIDSIAKNGVRFTDGYVTAPVCAPSRAGFMSGRHQSRFGWNYSAWIRRFSYWCNSAK